MKAKLYIMLLLLLCATAGKGQEYHVETPGTLQEVIGEGAEELTHIRVTGTLNDQDIAFLHSLCWPVASKPANMKAEDYLRIAREKEDTLRTSLRHLDMEDARLVNDALPDDAFHGSYIKDYKLPKTLKKIGNNAFQGNFLLTELVIPESVEEIGSHLLFFSINVEKVRLPDNLEVLNGYLFTYCWALQEVNIPSKLREIHEEVFSGCTKLPPSVSILPETLEIWDGSAYGGIPGIEEVVIPKNVKVLKSAFWGMEDLRKATILTQKLTEIGDYTFHACSALEEVNIPYNITRIGKKAFYLCSKLRKVDIPSTVTRIEREAFESVPMEVVDLPAGLTFIGWNAFAHNGNLKVVYARPVVPPVTYSCAADNLPFYYSSTETATLYVPKGSMDAYRASDLFCDFGKIVELEEWQWPTSVGTPTLSPRSYQVYGADGKLHIGADGNGSHEAVAVGVYGVGGASVWQGEVTNQVEIPLPKGFYVVRVGQATHKVSL